MFPCKKKTPLAIVITILAGAASVFVITLIVAFATQIINPQSSRITSAVVTNKNSSFNVQGRTSIETIPDEAQINLGIEAQAASVQAAQNQMNTVINQLTAALKALGISESKIQTANYSIFPNYDYSSSGQSRIIGYRASSSVNITVTDFDLLNQAIDTATATGVNQIYGITFNLSETKQAEVKKQARAQAIEDAKNNAAELSRLTGMQLGKIIDVQENTGDNFSMLNSYSRAPQADTMAMGMKEETGVSPGSTSFTYTVTLSYQTI